MNTTKNRSFLNVEMDPHIFVCHVRSFIQKDDITDGSQPWFQQHAFELFEEFQDPTIQKKEIKLILLVLSIQRSTRNENL